MIKKCQTGLNRKHSGFTLVEMLVVIAITVILFTLLLKPLVESLGLTARAQVLSAGQDAARKAMEMISRDLSGAVYVFDNDSHPFALTSPPTLPTDDRYTNFLDMEVLAQDGTYVVEHAFNAKLDIVPARHAFGTSLAVDPTTHEPININPQTNQLGGTSLMFPLAPDTIVIRYFIGLQHPCGINNTAVPYGDPYDYHSSVTENTYVLYRVAFQPYTTVKNKDGTYVNELLFAPQHDSSGNIINKPEMDDPDFFRIVSTSDINWLTDGHTKYTSFDVTDRNTNPAKGPISHNTRVEFWSQLAKPVITAPDIDLLQLPHNPDGTINFSNVTQFAEGGPGPQADGDPCSSMDSDPVTHTLWPVVDTTVTFKPAAVTADAAPGTTTDNAAEGIPAGAADSSGLPYIPTYYTASSKSWAYPYKVSIYSLYYDQNAPLATNLTGSSKDPYFVTGIGSTRISNPALNMYVEPGDLLEYYMPTLNTQDLDTTGSTTPPVYDVSTGTVLTTPASSGNPYGYVPMALDPDKGTVNFDVPAIPLPANLNTRASYAYDRYLRFWSANPDLINNGSLAADYDASGLGHAGVIYLNNLYCDNTGTLTQGSPATTSGFNTSPIPLPDNQPTAGEPCACPFAHPVPGSFRIYGPDANPGPNYGNSVLYTEVSPGATLQPNQYEVDYLNDTVTFDVSSTPGAQLPAPAHTTTQDDWVKIAFDYQANMRPEILSSPISSGNPALPMAVKVDYQTRDLLNVTVGVRVFDQTTGQAFLIPVSSQIQVGNSNR